MRPEREREKKKKKKNPLSVWEEGVLMQYRYGGVRFSEERSTVPENQMRLF